MTPADAAADATWAPLARSSREALSLLGYHVEDKCLPDEPAPCGGSFALHAVAQLSAIIAAADHHLAHLGADQSLAVAIYEQTAADIHAGCSPD
jgi:hypothetical protein